MSTKGIICGVLVCQSVTEAEMALLREELWG